MGGAHAYSPPAQIGLFPPLARAVCLFYLSRNLFFLNDNKVMKKVLPVNAMRRRDRPVLAEQRRATLVKVSAGPPLA